MSELSELINIRVILQKILETLQEMKQQEFDYWEAWKKAKNKEQNTDEKERET